MARHKTHPPGPGKSRRKTSPKNGHAIDTSKRRRESGKQPWLVNRHKKENQP